MGRGERAGKTPTYSCIKIWMETPGSLFAGIVGIIRSATFLAAFGYRIIWFMGIQSSVSSLEKMTGIFKKTAAFCGFYR
jgi:hypothetical protein